VGGRVVDEKVRKKMKKRKGGRKYEDPFRTTGIHH
jgi:hypothetical protein